MNEQLRRQILREFPELAAGYHLPVMAEVVAATDPPISGGISDNYRPRYAVTVQLLTTDYQETDITLSNVPCSITGGGDERGFFALPQRGTIVELAWLNGSPERPFVRSVLGDRQALPWIDADTMAWQQSEDAFQRVDAAGNWKRTTDKTISDESHRYQQQAAEAVYQLGNEVRRILQNSVEDIDGKKQIEATAIHLLSATVVNLLAAGSINQAAAEHITRSAAKTIKDHATGSISISTDASADITAKDNISVTAKKINIGTDTDNLLKLISDCMQACIDAMTNITTMTVTCADPSKPSGVPINAAAFTAISTQITALKTKLDGMTLASDP